MWLGKYRILHQSFSLVWDNEPKTREKDSELIPNFELRGYLCTDQQATCCGQLVAVPWTLIIGADLYHQLVLDVCLF